MIHLELGISINFHLFQVGLQYNQLPTLQVTSCQSWGLEFRSWGVTCATPRLSGFQRPCLPASRASGPHGYDGYGTCCDMLIVRNAHPTKYSMCIYIYINIYKYIYIHIYIYIHVYIHICIYIHVYIYIHGPLTTVCFLRALRNLKHLEKNCVPESWLWITSKRNASAQKKQHQHSKRQRKLGVMSRPLRFVLCF